MDETKDDLRRPGVEEPFSSAIQRCMRGGGEPGLDVKGATPGKGVAAAAAAAEVVDVAEVTAPERKKLIQGDEGGSRRRAFGQLYEELSELAFK